MSPPLTPFTCQAPASRIPTVTLHITNTLMAQSWPSHLQSLASPCLYLSFQIPQRDIRLSEILGSASWVSVASGSGGR